MQSYHVVAVCAGYTRNAVTSNALTLISGAPDTRAQHSLLNSESGKGWERKAQCCLRAWLSRGHALCWRWLLHRTVCGIINFHRSIGSVM